MYAHTRCTLNMIRYHTTLPTNCSSKDELAEFVLHLTIAAVGFLRELQEAVRLLGLCVETFAQAASVVLLGRRGDELGRLERGSCRGCQGVGNVNCRGHGGSLRYLRDGRWKFRGR
jgi:hypothetical protein